MTSGANLICRHGRKLRRLSMLVVSSMTVAMMGPSALAQELSRTPFTMTANNSCPASASCPFDFGTFPGGNKRRYEITTASCYLGIGHLEGRVLYWFLYATRDGKDFGRIHMRPTPLGIGPNVATFSATEQGLLIVHGGGTIGVAITRDSSSSGGIDNVDCTIGGYDVRLQ